MIKYHGEGMFSIGDFNIDFRLRKLLDFYVGFSIGGYIPVTIRLGWVEIAFYNDNNYWFLDEDYCDDECCK